MHGWRMRTMDDATMVVIALSRGPYIYWLAIRHVTTVGGAGDGLDDDDGDRRSTIDDRRSPTFSIDMHACMHTRQVLRTRRL